MFLGLDENFDNIGEIPAINMQWRRRYYEYGDFEFQIRAEDYDPRIVYVWNTLTNEVANVEKGELKTEGHGNFVYISGYFVEVWLSRGVVLNDLATKTKITTLCPNLVSTRVISDLGLNLIEIGDIKTSSVDTDAYPENETEVGLITQKLLKSIDYSQRLFFDSDNKKFEYQIWQGIDRSQENEYSCVFSDRLGNISNLEYSSDDSDYKNYAEIKISRGGDPERFIYTNYNYVKDNEPVRKLRLDISDTESSSDSQAIAAAKEKGLLELLNHRIVENANFGSFADWYEYMKDFDLGDKVHLVVTTMELSAAFRIIEIDEVYKNNTREITLQFGDMKKLNYKKGRF